ncbi:SAM-dependent methyltransferase/uncharacterized protein YbaR (Trm112 family) [Kutzneria viridogrisea]|uniref:SAM-dependent methyltransferase/uncharacterized protein YbaR (Trm112 family) n=1 Tax=Kutzneria viridogrisea TaxID=47990 RepID=A0ABR6BCM8_9PSEU|nr:SAM-dependent methyltransferase/uncharacterized protein YbaR (Trm112 family) [Kutzneria viridogrisea]
MSTTPHHSLRCPHCRTPLHHTPVPCPALPGRPFGTLDCGTHSYPVIDGIPVIRHGRVPVQDHTTDTVEVPGPTVATLLADVRAGRGHRALVRLLAFDPELPWPLPRVPVLRTALTTGPALPLARWHRRRTVRRLLTEDTASQTAQDWMQLFYLRSRGIDREQYTYFFHRFAQPRTLAALALLGTLPQHDPRPVLDLACGFGHLTHAIGHRGHEVLGTDRNYFQLWVARHFLAPKAQFVCADAADPLPFAEGAFSAALCADAFHLLPGKQHLVGELRRTTPDGPLLITRTGNALVQPNEGRELSPTGYTDLLGDLHHQVFDDQELISAYLANTAPRPLDQADTRKWITILATPRPVTAPRPRPDGHWPHAAGTLTVNPVYHRTPTGTGEQLLFQFPSCWYAFENHAMLDYHLPATTVDAATLADLDAGRGQAAVRELISGFAVIGVPDRYARAR